MKNLHEKYGRDKKYPVLLDAIPVVGWRKVNIEVHKALPHYFPHYQLIVILEGHANFWSKEKIYSVNSGEMILFKPYQIVGTLGNTMPKTERCFLQFKTSPLANLKYVKPQVSIEDFFPNLKEMEVMDSGNVPSLIKKIIEEHRAPSKESLLLCEMYLVEILIEIKRLYKIGSQSESRGLQKMVDDYIDKNMSKKITTSDIAKFCSYSPSYFRSLLENSTGLSPNKYVQHRRYLKACELLEKSNMSIFEIAMDLGFSSSQYFATTFKSITAMTPQEFREYYQTVMNSKVVPLENNTDVAMRNAKHFVPAVWF